MSDFLKFISLISVGAGPFVSNQMPALAPDLRKWAWWLSAVFSTVTWLWSNARLSRPRAKTLLYRDLQWSLAILSGAAVAYFLVNLVWTRESGDIRDLFFESAIVALYATCFASLTFALVVGQKLNK